MRCATSTTPNEFVGEVHRCTHERLRAYISRLVQERDAAVEGRERLLDAMNVTQDRSRQKHHQER